MEQICRDILSGYKNITQIQDISYIKVYSGKSYQNIYKFMYAIDTTGIPIIIGIPVDWDKKLIDVYIENYRKFKYIPHLDTDGKLCLFDLEGVLIDKNFEGLLYQTFDRLNKVLHDGLNELNKQDFIEEFEQYWRRLPNAKVLKSMIYPTKDIKLIKYADNRKKVKMRKNDKFVDVLRRENRYMLAASDSEKDFAVYKDMNTFRNGVYVYIDSDEYIFPPDWRDKLDIDYINNLLRHKSLEKRELMDNIDKCKQDLVLVFNIKQPNNCINIFGVIIKNFIISKSSEVPQIKSYQQLIPCNVIRCDKEFLLNRGGALTNITNKNILVIGCGSIGGYLINELVKIGINKIMLVDDDKLKEENIYRHLLGMEYVGEYKSKAMSDYINKNIPNIDIKSLQDNIEDAIYDESILLSNYDLIISAVGNHNVNRWINEYVRKYKIEAPVVYLWNEVLGVGNHVAFIANKYDGCYECFFGRNEDELIYDKTSYCEAGQLFTKKVSGCGSSYLPFSSTNSVATVTTGIEVIKNYFEGRINENMLISVKDDDYYFKKAGFITSNSYRVQSQVKIIVEGKKFKKENCSVCGGRKYEYND